MRYEAEFNDLISRIIVERALYGAEADISVMLAEAVRITRKMVPRAQFADEVHAALVMMIVEFNMGGCPANGLANADPTSPNLGAKGDE